MQNEFTVHSGEIIAIGDELVTGRVLNETSAFAANRLFAAGYQVKRLVTIGDDPEYIKAALNKALTDSSFVIVTGGLGPTSDDITSEVAASVFRKKLVRNQEIFEKIKSHASHKNQAGSGLIEKLAMLPEGAKALNTSGHASGYFIEHRGVHLFFLPGIPSQMKRLFDNFVMPQLNKTMFPGVFIRQRIYKLFGMEETEINLIINSLTLKGVTVGYYPNFPEVHIHIKASGKDMDVVEGNFRTSCALVEERFREDIVAQDEDTLETETGRLLMDRKAMLAIAESCTGGLIASRITTAPGSSAWFERGIVSYSNQAKMDHLGVSPETLEKYGAVSEETAREMAEGIKKAARSDYSLAVTGIAGPTGGSPQKPVGTVYIAMSTPDKTAVRRFLFPGSRTMIQALASETAIDWLRRYLKYDSYIPCHRSS